MRVSRYALALVVPVPLMLITAYYTSSLIHSYLAPPPVAGKERVSLPDLQVKEARVKKDVIESLSYLEIRKPGRLEAVSPREEGVPERPPSYRVTFTYVGVRRNYAIINGLLFREGDHISPHERIVKITREGVLLSGRWGERWLKVLE
ncbi:MAG: hypothetical protein Q9N26_08480 [Aquificota bacterium]|nr:hypothetical protein [Aquificota bacterium]